MRNYARAILFYLLAVEGFAAKVPTFTQKASKTYIGTTASKVKVAANDIDIQDKGNLVITFGTDYSAKIISVLKKDCKDPSKDACQKNLKKAIGIGSNANGLTRRVIERRALGIDDALAFVIATVPVIIAYIFKDEPYTHLKVVQIEVPEDQKDDVQKWKGGGDTFKYKPTKGNPITVKLDPPGGKPKNPPTLKKGKDGSLAVTFPGLGSVIKNIFKKVVCKREEPHPLEKRINTQCLLAYAKALIGAMQVGAPLEAARYINPFKEFPKPKNKLLVETITSDNNYVDSGSLWFGGDEEKDLKEAEVKKRIADLSSWMAFGYIVGHLTVDGDKISFPKTFLEDQEEEEEKKDKCFKEPSFCINCGGNTAKENYMTRIGKCAGVNGGALKGCQCYLDPDPHNNGPSVASMKAAYEALSKYGKSKPKPKTDPAATCKPDTMPPGFDGKQCSNCKDVTGGYNKDVYTAAAHQFCNGNYKWVAKEGKNMEAHAALTFDSGQKDPKTKYSPYCGGMLKADDWEFKPSSSQKYCKSKRGYSGEDSQIRLVVLASKSQNNCGALQHDYKLPTGDACMKKFDSVTNKCITGKNGKETGGFYLDKTGKGCFEWWILGKKIILTKEGEREVLQDAMKAIKKIIPHNNLIAEAKNKAENRKTS